MAGLLEPTRFRVRSLASLWSPRPKPRRAGSLRQRSVHVLRISACDAHQRILFLSVSVYCAAAVAALCLPAAKKRRRGVVNNMDANRLFQSVKSRFAARLGVAIVFVLVIPNPGVAQVTPRQNTLDSLRSVGGQIPPAQGGRPASAQDILNAILRSGLTPEEIRLRLKAAGYDPSMADPYLSGSASSGSGGSQSPPTSAFVEALRNAGILKPMSVDSDQDTSDPNPEANDISSAPDNSSANPGRPTAGVALRTFGKTLFGRTSTVFDPITSGPIDASYRIGVGDQVQVVLTGSVETAYQLEVRRDGTIVLPQVGQIPVAGLTLDAGRTLVRQRASHSYSGLTNGETSLDLSIARIRSNVVFVTGEVERPGAYQVNALSTAFHAIARAGGPTDRGSFRMIEVRRGGAVVKQVDLYDYLLRGDASSDVRTEQGDIIFVPLNLRSIGLRGAVRRPGMFELRPNEGFPDLLRFSGGLLPDAAVERVQIDRILPAEQRRPGRERVVLDLRISGKLDSLSAVPLQEGDVVTVFSIGDLRRNIVTLSGEVFKPGTYQFTPGMTLQGLIESAQGTLPWAMTDRVKVIRPVAETGRMEIISLDLHNPQDGSLPLREYDRISVLDGREAFPEGRIQVIGAVHRPGPLPFAERQTLQDVIDLVGGFGEDAAGVDVSRRRRARDYSDTTSIVTRFTIDANGVLEQRAREFFLERDDRVLVRSAPGFREQRFVDVSGLFRYPGSYPITANDDRLLSVVQRAGGVLPDAYLASFRLVRAGQLVAIDLEAALKGNKDQNPRLLANDQLFVGPISNTVYVVGEVERPSLVLFKRGRSLQEYIELAGGPTLAGDVSRALVSYPSGRTVRTVHRFMMPDAAPPILAGSIIRIPERPTPKPGNFAQNVATTSNIIATLASLAITYIALIKK